MKNDKKELTLLQKHLLEMMVDFHHICQQNNLTYYLMYGTLLGAKRHKGFIPWDDDIDVGMPRDDYDLFMRLPSACFPKHLSRIDKWHGQSKGSFLYVKLVDNSTTLIENFKEKHIEGVFIDIYPIDGAGNFKIIGILKLLISRTLSSIIRLNSRIETQKNIFKRVGQLVFKPLDNRKIYNVSNNFLRKTPFNTSKYILNFVADFNVKELVKKEIYEKPVLYDFEKYKFYGPADAHSLLKKTYGDYETLPPIEERISHHFYEYLNFDIGYENYTKLHL